MTDHQYQPDANGECTICDEPADAHLDERATPNRQRPAVEETWSCPHCASPATAFVSVRRVIACGRCRAIFEVGIVGYTGPHGDLYAAAARRAESSDEPLSLMH